MGPEWSIKTFYSTISSWASKPAGWSLIEMFGCFELKKTILLTIE